MITTVAVWFLELFFIMAMASAWMVTILVTVLVAIFSGMFFYGAYKNIKNWITKGSCIY